jgi:DNA repair protein RadC
MSSAAPLLQPDLFATPVPRPGPVVDAEDADLIAGLLAVTPATPLVAQLLGRFGSAGGVLAADPDDLKALGMSRQDIERLGVARRAARCLCRTRVLDRPVLSHWQALLDYCHVTHAGLRREELRALFLDRKNRLIADEVLGTGSVDHVPLYPREVLRRALALDATALILVHNHPSGDPTPSETDIAMTHRLRDSADLFGITLHDHLVIGHGRHVSFRSEGLF